jgi:hypothetical protein
VDTGEADDTQFRDDQVFELARRLVTPRQLRRDPWWYRPREERTPCQLLVGQMPPDFPSEIPIPEGAHILGSLVLAGGIQHHRVVFDADGSPEDIQRFYDERLTAQGWLHPPERRPFPPPAETGESTAQPWTRWFKSEEGPALVVSTFLQSGSVTDAELTLDLNPRQCRVTWQQHLPQTGEEIFDIFRQLPPPPRSQLLFSRGASGSGGESHVREELETELAVADVLDHYAAQLRTIGWEAEDRAVSKAIGAATWHFDGSDGNPWWAALTVVQDPWTANHQALNLDAQREGRDELPRTASATPGS